MGRKQYHDLDLVDKNNAEGGKTTYIIKINKLKHNTQTKDGKYITII